MPKLSSFKNTTTAESITEGMDLTGKNFLLTGCNSGIGFETMRVLLLRGGTVYGTARTMIKAKEAGRLAKGSHKNGKMIPLACDLTKLSTVQKVIATINAPLDGVIANAGVMALPTLELVSGIEKQFYTNHLGHFVLITGLLSKLNAAARIVIVSSAAHGYAKGKNISFNDLGWKERSYTPWVSYGISKLANILFTKELALRIKKGQTVNALHPGVVDTNLFRNLSKEQAASMKQSFKAKEVGRGAALSLFLLTSELVSHYSGEYFSNGVLGKPSTLAQDKNLAKELWNVSEQLI